MEIKQKIKLDFGNSVLPVTVFAKQGDSESRYIEVEPLNNGQPYEIPEDVTARLHLTKADGTQIINNAEITADGNIIAELTEQALAAEGLATAEIGLYQSTALLSSQLFFVKVVHSAYSGELTVSTSEYQALVNALAVADRATGIAQGAASTASAATSAANAATSAANTAASTANTAAQRADTAAANAEKVDAELELEDGRAVFTVTNRTGETKSINVSAIMVFTDTWAQVRNAVRLGLARQLFPAGFEFTTPHRVMGEIVWRVVKHYQDAGGKWRMRLEMKHAFGTTTAYKGVVFDAPEAMYYAAEELPAGTYNFTWNYETGSMVNGTYQFTLTQPVPAGGQIVLGTNSSSTAITSCRISTYAQIGGRTAIESGIIVTAGSGGTSLGTISATAVSDENLNCGQCIMWGSNNYAQSAKRQWLNSTAAQGSVWTPQTKFDRPPSWETGTDAVYAGFMGGFNDDFLDVVQPTEIPCRTNSVFETASLDGTVFEVNSVYTLSDKFFLLSRPEIFGTYDNNAIRDGELLEFYDGATAEDRKKYDAFGTVRNSPLRSPYPSLAYNVRTVSMDGSLNRHYASSAYAAAPACEIA